MTYRFFVPVTDKGIGGWGVLTRKLSRSLSLLKGMQVERPTEAKASTQEY